MRRFRVLTGWAYRTQHTTAFLDALSARNLPIASTTQMSPFTAKGPKVAAYLSLDLLHSAQEMFIGVPRLLVMMGSSMNSTGIIKIRCSGVTTYKASGWLRQSMPPRA